MMVQIRQISHPKTKNLWSCNFKTTQLRSQLSVNLFELKHSPKNVQNFTKTENFMDYEIVTCGTVPTDGINVANVGTKPKKDGATCELFQMWLKNHMRKNFQLLKVNKISIIQILVCRLQHEVLRVARERKPWSSCRVFCLVDRRFPNAEPEIISGEEMAARTKEGCKLAKAHNFLNGNQMKIWTKYNGQIEIRPKAGSFFDIIEFQPKTGWDHIMCDATNFPSDTPTEFRQLLMCNQCKLKNCHEHDDVCLIRGLAVSLNFLKNFENGKYKKPCSVGALQFMLRRLLHEADPQLLPKLKTMDDAMLYAAARKCASGKQIGKELPNQVDGLLRLGRLISGELEIKDSWKPVSASHLIKRKSKGPFNSYRLVGLPKPFLAPRRLENCSDEPILTLKSAKKSGRKDSPKDSSGTDKGQDGLTQDFENLPSPSI